MSFHRPSSHTSCILPIHKSVADPKELIKSMTQESGTATREDTAIDIYENSNTSPLYVSSLPKSSLPMIALVCLAILMLSAGQQISHQQLKHQMSELERARLELQSNQNHILKQIDETYQKISDYEEELHTVSRKMQKQKLKFDQLFNEQRQHLTASFDDR